MLMVKTANNCVMEVYGMFFNKEFIYIYWK